MENALLFAWLIGTIVVGAQSLWYRLKYLDATAKLDRLSATEDEIMCILDATDTPFAKRLLEFAKQPIQLPEAATSPLVKPVDDDEELHDGDEISPQDFAAIEDELRIYRADPFRLDALEIMVNNGLRFSSKQRRAILATFDADPFRVDASELLS